MPALEEPAEPQPKDSPAEEPKAEKPSPEPPGEPKPPRDGGSDTEVEEEEPPPGGDPQPDKGKDCERRTGRGQGKDKHCPWL